MCFNCILSALNQTHFTTVGGLTQKAVLLNS